MAAARGLCYAVGMTPELLTALNGQIKLEYEAAFLYLRLAVSMQEYGLPGCAHWLLCRHREEQEHALRLIRHMEDRRVCPAIPDITAPAAPWDTPQEAFRLVQDHEQRITESIHHLVSLARKQQDYATEQMLMWFVAEQTEEEKSIGEILDRLRMANNEQAGLLRVDESLRGSK